MEGSAGNRQLAPNCDEDRCVPTPTETAEPEKMPPAPQAPTAETDGPTAPPPTNTTSP
jgi:hypothetical protein